MPDDGCFRGKSAVIAPAALQQQLSVDELVMSPSMSILSVMLQGLMTRILPEIAARQEWWGALDLLRIARCRRRLAVLHVIRGVEARTAVFLH